MTLYCTRSWFLIHYDEMIIARMIISWRFVIIVAVSLFSPIFISCQWPRMSQTERPPLTRLRVILRYRVSQNKALTSPCRLLIKSLCVCVCVCVFVLQCLQCSAEVEKGVYWQCTECPQATPTHLCNKCINRCGNIFASEIVPIQ